MPPPPRFGRMLSAALLGALFGRDDAPVTMAGATLLPEEMLVESNLDSS